MNSFKSDVVENLSNPILLGGVMDSKFVNSTLLYEVLYKSIR